VYIVQHRPSQSKIVTTFDFEIRRIQNC